MEEAKLLHLLSIPHFHRPPIAILVIRQLLCLVHDGYLWLDKPIPIRVELIHRIYRLPFEGRGPTEIIFMSGDLTLMEAMKKKYKLEKKQRGCAITSIQDKGVHIAT